MNDTNNAELLYNGERWDKILRSLDNSPELPGASYEEGLFGFLTIPKNGVDYTLGAFSDPYGIALQIFRNGELLDTHLPASLTVKTAEELVECLKMIFHMNVEQY